MPADKEDKHAKTIEELDEIAVEKWEVSLLNAPLSLQYSFRA